MWDLGTSFTAVEMGYHFSKAVQLVGDSRMIIYRLLFFFDGVDTWDFICMNVELLMVAGKIVVITVAIGT